MPDKDRTDKDKYYGEIVAALTERVIKRLWILCLVQSLLLFGCIGYIIWEKEVYDVSVTETYTSESDDGGIAIVNRDGEVNYGESDLYPY